MSALSNFEIGDIVTLKTHPLLNNDAKKIIEFPAQVPPLMLVKEVLIERKEKKKIYSDEIENARISDLVKYLCIYFNGNKGEFVEVTLYHSLLESYKKLKYYREFEKDKKVTIELDDQLIPEVLRYSLISEYEYGRVVQLKTKKLEQRKSYSGAGERIPGATFQTPDFLLTGVKNESQTDLYYPDGKTKRKITKQLYKIMWFNSIQQKFSEYFLPKEFLVEGLEM